MKIAHISDLHYSPEHLEEVDRCVEFALSKASDSECDCAVISGDLFDHRIELHQPAVSILTARIRDLVEYMPVLILQGTFSHDTPGSLDVFRYLGGSNPVCVVDKISQAALIENTVDGQRLFLRSEGWVFDGVEQIRSSVPACWNIVALFSCLPPVHKGQIAAAAGVDDAAGAAGEYVHNLMRGWSVINEEARAAGIPTIVVSHGTVNGSMTEQGVPMHGNDHEFSTGTLFASQASAIMLGHIHQHQEWEQDGRYIAYPGSPSRLHFGELTDKGFLIWKIEGGHTGCEFIKTPAKELIQIDFEGEPDMSALQEQAAKAAGAHVRIRWNVDEEHKDGVDKAAIEALFEGSAEVKLEGRINPIQTQRAAGISQLPELNDKLARWAELSGADSELLIFRLNLLRASEPEQIVKTLLDIPSNTATEVAA